MELAVVSREDAGQTLPIFKEITKPTERDRTIIAVCEAVLAGKNVIDLHRIMGDVGVGTDGYPKLAVARAEDFRVTYSPDAREFRSRTKEWNLRESIEIGSLPLSQLPRAVAIIPSVPAKLRTTAPRHLLWEATWNPLPIHPDPILLERIGLSLFFIVVASWNLTPIEAAILSHGG